MKARSLCFALIGLAATAAHAQNLFQNPSFETNTAGPLGAALPNNFAGGFVTLAGGSTAITNWTAIGQSIDYVNNAFWQAQNGSWSVDLAGTNAATGMAAGGIQQFVGKQKKGTYDLSFYLSGNPSGPPVTKSMLASWTTGSQVFTYNTAAKGNTLKNMMYQLQTTQFFWKGGNLSISFATNTGDANNTQYGPVLDNASLMFVSPTPGPAAVLPFIGGVLAAVRRKRASRSRRVA